MLSPVRCAPPPDGPSGSHRLRHAAGGGVARVTAVLAASAAFSKDVGLIATFIGIGVIVNVIVVYIAIQIRGERLKNQEHLSRRPPTSV